MILRLLRWIWGGTGRPAAASRPRLEPLEDRTLPAALLPGGFEETPFVRGIDSPVAMAFAPDGRLFVTEQTGRVRVVKDGQLLPAPFLTVPVQKFRERGLLGLAFDPHFASNRFVYVYYTPAFGRAHNRISRFTASAADPDQAEPGSEVVLLDNIPSRTGFHNGGGLHFGPDGMLYVSVGDSGERQRAQDLGTHSGKILRLNVANFPNLVPRSNPFVGRGGAARFVWALGFRNPFTFAFQPGTRRLFVNDVGEVSFEEVDRVLRGGNYGWPFAEGFVGRAGFLPPVLAYPHTKAGGAITGGVFYQASLFPASFQGSYFFADYVNRFIRRIAPGHHRGLAFASRAASPIDLDVGPDGRLYYLSLLDGAVYAIGYVGAANRVPEAVASASPTSGSGPLGVGFSAAGSSDPDGDALTYQWDFGDNSPPAEGLAVSHVYTDNGRYLARLMVRDAHGAAAAAEPIPITVGNHAPTAQIVFPTPGQRFRIGASVPFFGIANDVEDGPLHPTAFQWTIVFHHKTHIHPFLGPLGGSSGSFRIPRRSGAHARDLVWYRIHLTVTDSGGLQGSTFVDVYPRRH